jgi:hypothetical protein
MTSDVRDVSQVATNPKSAAALIKSHSQWEKQYSSSTGDLSDGID